MNTRLTRIGLLLSFLAVLGCGAPEGDFTLEAQPRTLPLYYGEEAELRIVALRQNATERIELQLTGLPDGVTASSAVLEPGQSEATIRVQAHEGVPLDDYGATIVAVDREVSAPVTLAVSGVPVILHPETRVLDDDARAAMTEFQADGTLVFSADAGNAQALEPGHVVVSAPTEAAPWGVLRRVSTLEHSGDVWVVRTTEATLLEVFQQADIRFRARWDGDLAEQGQGLGVRKQGLGAAFKVGVDAVIFDIDGNHSTTDDQLKATGAVNLNADAGVDYGIRYKFPLSFSSYFFAGVEVNETASLSVVGKASTSIEKSIDIQPFHMSPIVVMVGPVPVVFVPKLVVGVGAKGSLSGQFSYGATQHFSAGAGLKYDNGWHDITGVNTSYTSTPASFEGAVQFDAHAFARFEFLLYGVIGPTATVKGVIGFDAAVPRKPAWKLEGGVIGEVAIDALGYKYSKKVLDKRVAITESQPQPPSLTVLGPANGSTQEYGGFRPISFDAVVNDQEDGPDGVNVTWSSDRDGVLGTGRTISYPFSTQGTRKITVTATDSDGMSTSRNLSLNFINSPPTVKILSPAHGSTHYVGDGVTFEGQLSDPNELGALACDRLTWTSSIPADGSRTGCIVSWTFSTAGARTLTLRGVDAEGLSAQDAITVDVVPVPPMSPPLVTLSSPAPNHWVAGDSSTVLQLVGSASDPDGKTPVVLEWTAIYNGQRTLIGQGSPFDWHPFPTYSTCPQKEVTIELKATDPDGQSATKTVRIYVGRVAC